MLYAFRRSEEKIANVGGYFSGMNMESSTKQKTKTLMSPTEVTIFLSKIDHMVIKMS